jgi:hypothetical protein
MQGATVKKKDKRIFSLRMVFPKPTVAYWVIV